MPKGVGGESDAIRGRERIPTPHSALHTPQRFVKSGKVTGRLRAYHCYICFQPIFSPLESYCFRIAPYSYKDDNTNIPIPVCTVQSLSSCCCALLQLSRHLSHRQRESELPLHLLHNVVIVHGWTLQHHKCSKYCRWEIIRGRKGSRTPSSYIYMLESRAGRREEHSFHLKSSTRAFHPVKMCLFFYDLALYRGLILFHKLQQIKEEKV